MKKTFAIAACAALSLTIAACGDDDDDASGDTTVQTTPEVADTEVVDTDSPDTSAAGTGSDGTADVGSDDTTTEPGGTLSGDDAELSADCESFQTIFETEFEDEPAVGEEITDEYREQLESFKSQVEDLDLNTDLADGARDAFGDLIDEVADADTMPENIFGDDTPDALTEFGERCQALLGTSD